MTGPEHYREAEEKLARVRRSSEDPTRRMAAEKAATLLAEAQVHATLALAAATAHHTVPTSRPDWSAWGAAVGTEDSSEGNVADNAW